MCPPVHSTARMRRTRPTADGAKKISAACPRAASAGAYYSDMDRIIERLRAVTVNHSTVDAARAIRALSDADLVRLKALARLWSRGLPGGLGWVDVLNEAIVRVLDGTRAWPPGVPLLAFL